jgi:putative aldouronate transport system substrate-binding protein
MRKKLNQALAIVLSAATVMSLTVGCSSANNSSKASSTSGSSAASSQNGNVSTKDGFFWSKDPMTFSVLFSDNTAYPYKDSWTFFKTLQEKTNVKLEPQIVAMSDYTSKRSVLIASGQAPMIIPKTYAGQEDQFVPSGAILPISDYVSQMPYFSKEIKDWKLEEDLKTITQGDGKYYIMPGLHQSYIQDYSLAVRSDILTKNNIKTPETWDELYTVLKKLKELYPTVTPFSDKWQLGATMQMAGPGFVKTQTGLKGTDADWTGNLLAFDSDKKTFSFYPTMSGYKDELTYFSKLVKEGLLDPESATQTSDQALNKFATGKSFVISTNSQGVNKDLRPKCEASLGKGNFEVTKINVPAGPAGKFIQGNRLENGVMISKKAKDDKNFSTLIQFVDWLWNSDKGQEYGKWGIENETFTKSGDKYTLKDGYTFPDVGLNASATTAKNLRKDMGFGSGVFILTYGGPDVLAHSYMAEEDITFSENVNKTRTLLPVAPKIAYDTATQEKQNQKNTALKDYVGQMSYKFILGKANIATDWDKYVADLKAKGSEDFTKTANDVYAKQSK